MALGRITGQASEFQKSLDASTARVFAFGATTAILNSVNQAFKKLVSTTIEVEKRLIEINSIFQANDKTFNKFRTLYSKLKIQDKHSILLQKVLENLQDKVLAQKKPQKD